MTRHLAISVSLAAVCGFVPETTWAQDSTRATTMTRATDLRVGRVTKTGVMMQAEGLVLTLDPRRAEALRSGGARETLTRLLEQSGIKVNGLLFDDARLTEALRAGKQVSCYHIVSPAEEKSNTVCL